MMRPGHSRLLGLAALVLASLDPARAQVIFGSDVTNETLVSINGATRVGTTQGSSITDVTGLAWDSVHSVLYGVASGNLYSINPANGGGTFRSSLSTGGNPNGLAYDPALNRLFITDNNSNSLFSYDLGTDSLALIGAISGGFGGVEGLGYDPYNEILFGLADDQQQIVNIDTTDGTTFALPNVLPTGHNWRGLDFDPGTGLLFATWVGSGGNHLYSVDPLTGIGTDLGAITGAGTFNFLQGLAVQYTYSPIPEPAHAALLLSLAGTLLLGLSRRRKKSPRLFRAAGA